MASDGPPGAVSNTDFNSWNHGELQAKLAEFGAPNMGEMNAFVDELCGGVFLSLASVSRLACYISVCCSGLYCPKLRADVCRTCIMSYGKLYVH